MTTEFHAPPDIAIRAAVEAGSRSPCAKSKRGAVVFSPYRNRLGVGCNAQPAPFTCTNDERCRAYCSRLCEHAEHRAIRDALCTISEVSLAGYEAQLVHAKVVDGALVAGGGPSCWQCSREVLSVGLDGVWLYKLPTVAEANAEGVTHMDDPRFLGLARWRYYTAEDFHRATLAECRIGAVP
jgi:deoxycytidylate deaminase